MIRETNAPKAYVHKTDYEKTVDVAALHAGKPIRRITHTDDIYPPKKSVKRTRVAGRSTEARMVDRINRLMAWMAKQAHPVTLEQMEKAAKFKMHSTRGRYSVECSVQYLVKNGYIVQVVKPAKDRKSLYKCLKETY